MPAAARFAFGKLSGQVRPACRTADRRAEKHSHACGSRLALPPPLADRVGWTLRPEKGLRSQFPLLPSPGGQIHATTAKPRVTFSQGSTTFLSESLKSTVGLDPRTERWSPHGWEGKSSLILGWDPTSPSHRAGQAQHQHRAPGLGPLFPASSTSVCLGIPDPTAESTLHQQSAFCPQPCSSWCCFPKALLPAGQRPAARSGSAALELGNSLTRLAHAWGSAGTALYCFPRTT